MSRGRTITEADVVQFAALTGDMHPQHTDAAWAADSRFGGRIAHGMLVLSYCVGLIDFDPERVVALRRVADVVFKRPVALGDTIRVESEVVAREELDEEHSLVTCRWRVRNQDDRLVLRATVELVWREPPDDGPAGARDAAARHPDVPAASLAAPPPSALDDGFVPIPL